MQDQDREDLGDRARYHSLRALSLVEGLGLVIISIMTIIAAAVEVQHMIHVGKVTLADLLLMFLYLEVLAMVAVYLEYHRLPVRLPIYIGIIALARYLILDIKEMSEWRMLAVAGAVLLLALSVLLIRFGHNRFPYAIPYEEGAVGRRFRKRRVES